MIEQVQFVPFRLRQHLEWSCPVCGQPHDRAVTETSSLPEEVVCWGPRLLAGLKHCYQVFHVQYDPPRVEVLVRLTEEEAERRKKRGEARYLMEVTDRGRADPPVMIFDEEEP